MWWAKLMHSSQKVKSSLNNLNSHQFCYVCCYLEFFEIVDSIAKGKVWKGVALFGHVLVPFSGSSEPISKKFEIWAPETFTERQKKKFWKSDNFYFWATVAPPTLNWFGSNLGSKFLIWAF